MVDRAPSITRAFQATSVSPYIHNSDILSAGPTQPLSSLLSVSTSLPISLLTIASHSEDAITCRPFHDTSISPLPAGEYGLEDDPGFHRVEPEPIPTSFNYTSVFPSLSSIPSTPIRHLQGSHQGKNPRK